jgi:hypothetical protein
MANTPKRLVLRLSWAFGIIACMAKEEEKEEFRGIVYRAKQAGFWVGCVYKAMMLAEDCWRLRRTDETLSESVDWMVAMDSLGIKVLLVLSD